MRRWDEPSLKEREQLMGYEPDATKSAHVTIQQRAQRLGQAMDGNTMRWLGAYLSLRRHVYQQGRLDL